MSHTLADFLVAATQKAADDLVEAFLRIPEDKRNWQPEGKARSAADQVAECALLGGYTADLIRTRKWNDGVMGVYMTEKDKLVASGSDALNSLLQDNTKRVIEAIRSVPESDLATEIQMPWSKQTLAEVTAYPYWNMSYHQGQINYIASMLGCLD